MTETVTTPTPKLSAVLDEEWATGTGPKAKPSIFQDDVAYAALHPNEALITPITDERSDRYIVNQLHKAGKTLGVKVQTRVFDYKGKPAVKYRVVPVAEETAEAASE